MAVISKPALKALSATSDRTGALLLGRHLALVGLALWLVLEMRGTLWVWPAMALAGCLEVTLFMPLHETTHRTVFRTAWLNRAAGTALGLVLVLPYEWFRVFHLAHHRHAQDPAHDPELHAAPPMTRARYLLVLSGMPYWRGEIETILRSALGRVDAPWVPLHRRDAIMREARLYLSAYLALGAGAAIAGSTLPLLLWIGPVLLGQPVLRAILLAEHTGCPRVADPFANARTTLADRLLAMLIWNANLHAEHHLLPSVPSHALPALHAMMKDRWQIVAPDYGRAHGAIRAGLV